MPDSQLRTKSEKSGSVQPSFQTLLMSTCGPGLLAPDHLITTHAAMAGSNGPISTGHTHLSAGLPPLDVHQRPLEFNRGHRESMVVQDGERKDGAEDDGTGARQCAQRFGPNAEKVPYPGLPTEAVCPAKGGAYFASRWRTRGRLRQPAESCPSYSC